MEEVVRVFVGCAPNGDDAESMAVFDHSLRSRCSLPVEITWMQLSQQANSPFYSAGGVGWNSTIWATPFSGFRWAIPELCRFEGRAIYSDSDVMWRRDAAEMWRTPMHGRVLLAKGGEDNWRFCVSMWDCAAAKPHLPPLAAVQKDPDAHQKLQAKFRQQRGLVQAFSDVDWNVVDGEDYKDLSDQRIGALHYSSEAHQPHLPLAVPRMRALGRQHWFVAGGGTPATHWNTALSGLFDAELEAAKAAGYDPVNYEPALPYGHVRMASRAGYRSNRWAPAHARR